ncbi:MAG: ImmA/IrrE family metallo-endopeptidase [Desulfobacterales bacterium]|nr:ImmA/IrrE family metallo-endopeptidase [Desulfobacterales bacterium]
METDLNFVGKNIRFFRRSRNWTLQQLASKIGIQEGPLGRIERGINLPSANVLYQLSNTLKVSIDALFAIEPCHAPVEGSIVDDVCFISVDSTSPSPPKSLLQACHDIMKAFHALEDICQVQKYAYLPLTIPFPPTYQGIEQLAVRVRKYLGLGDSVVFDNFELFENFGLRIILFPFTRGATEFNSISFYEPAFHNAFFFLNSKQNPEKQLFSLSEELGKLLVSNQIRLQNQPLFSENENNSENLRPINSTRAAKRFAATFLMPETAVRATVSQLGITKQGWSWELLLRIKHRFGVSTESFLYRLKELDLITQDISTNLGENIKDYYQKTRYKEPDSTRRILTPNGRFFDLLTTAENIIPYEQEIDDIKMMVRKIRIIKI